MCFNRYYWHVFTSFILVNLVIACNNEKSQRGKIQHPVKEYMPSYSLIKQTENKEFEIDEIPYHDLKMLLASIQNAKKPIYTVGGASGDSTILFGYIEDVETNGDTVFILDNKKPSVIKLNASGSIVDVYGRMGRGPTDLLQPVDLEIAEDGRMFVADDFNETKVLRATEEGIVHDESFLTPGVLALDMCIMNEKMYIRSISKNQTEKDSSAYNLVHVYSLDNFEYIRGFGQTYQSPRLETNLYLSGGKFSHIECIESTDTVVYSYREFSYLYGFSGNGTLKWITELKPYKNGKVEETVSDGESVSMFFANEGDMILDISTLFGEYFLVRVLRSGEGVRSFILSSNTGQGFNLGYSTLPDIVNVDQNIFYIREWKDNFITLEAFER